MLSPAIPCHYHDTDIKMRDRLVRHLGALRRATRYCEQAHRFLAERELAPRLHGVELAKGEGRRTAFISDGEGRNR